MQDEWRNPDEFSIRSVAVFEFGNFSVLDEVKVTICIMKLEGQTRQSEQ